MSETFDPTTVPEVDPEADVGAAPVRPEDGKDPYPQDRSVEQDRPDGIV